jgi:hypothetical protein
MKTNTSIARAIGPTDSLSFEMLLAEEDSAASKRSGQRTWSPFALALCLRGSAAAFPRASDPLNGYHLPENKLPITL